MKLTAKQQRALKKLTQKWQADFTLRVMDATATHAVPPNFLEEGMTIRINFNVHLTAEALDARCYERVTDKSFNEVFMGKLPAVG